MRTTVSGILLPPNLVTASRVFLTLLLHRIYDGDRLLFLSLLSTAAATDILDGWLARRLRQSTPFGRNLDSLADFFLFTSAAWWLWKLQPAIYTAHPAQWTVTLAAVLIPQAVAFHMLRRNAAFHLYTARFSGAWALFCFFWALLIGYQPLFHAIFTAAMVVRNAETLAILLLVKDPYRDLQPALLMYARAGRLGSVPLSEPRLSEPRLSEPRLSEPRPLGSGGGPKRTVLAQ